MVLVLWTYCRRLARPHREPQSIGRCSRQLGKLTNTENAKSRERSEEVLENKGRGLKNEPKTNPKLTPKCPQKAHFAENEPKIRTTSSRRAKGSEGLEEWHSPKTRDSGHPLPLRLWMGLFRIELGSADRRVRGLRLFGSRRAADRKQGSLTRYSKLGGTKPECL